MGMVKISKGTVWEKKLHGKGKRKKKEKNKRINDNKQR